jgi:hypothetical protein
MNTRLLTVCTLASLVIALGALSYAVYEHGSVDRHVREEVRAYVVAHAQDLRGPQGPPGANGAPGPRGETGIPALPVASGVSSCEIDSFAWSTDVNRILDAVTTAFGNNDPNVRGYFSSALPPAVNCQ